MNAKTRLRDATRAAQREPANLVLRLRLAAALCETGQLPDALDLYRSVAVAYQGEGRLVQALAVCRSVLALAPDDFTTRALLADLEEARTGAAGEEPTRLSLDVPVPRVQPPLVEPQAVARLPEVEVAPEDYDFDDEKTGGRE